MTWTNDGLVYWHMICTAWPQWAQTSGPWFNKRCHLTGIRIPIIKMGWSDDHFIFIMDIPISEKTVLILRQGPDSWYLMISFPPNNHGRPKGQVMGCLSITQILSNVFLFPLLCCRQYFDMLIPFMLKSQEICTRFLLCCGYTLTDFPISIRLTSLALWQSNDCPSASKATLMNMDKYFMWIHYERLRNHNKAKHNKTVCIFLGIYCMLKSHLLSD